MIKKFRGGQGRMDNIFDAVNTRLEHVLSANEDCWYNLWYGRDSSFLFGDFAFQSLQKQTR